MRRKINIILPFFLLLILSCNGYRSIHPITDTSRSKIDERRLGEWIVLDSTDSTLFVRLHLKLLPLNEQEYLVTVNWMKDKGRIIDNTTNYKIHNSKINEEEYLNVLEISLKKEKYYIHKINEENNDSIRMNFLTDSLKIEFTNKGELANYIKENKNRVEREFMSESITYYRWEALLWDKVNLIDKTSEFKEFINLGRIDEERFKKLTKGELTEISKDNSRIRFDSIQEYFKEIHLSKYGQDIWKGAKFGLILLKSGKILRIKYDIYGGKIYDMTNDVYYRNKKGKSINKIKRK